MKQTILIVTMVSSLLLFSCTGMQRKGCIRSCNNSQKMAQCRADNTERTMFNQYAETVDCEGNRKSCVSSCESKYKENKNE